MASGVPVLAMARGGPAFVVEHRISGWLARSEQEFVDAGVRLVRDHELRARLAADARARATTWSWPTVCDELYSAYADISVATVRDGGPELALSYARAVPEPSSGNDG
jgi:phosphatidylinositol alpha 1,6-mannosyltransferase